LGFGRRARGLRGRPTCRLTFNSPPLTLYSPALRVSAGKSGVGGGECQVSWMQISVSFYCQAIPIDLQSSSSPQPSRPPQDSHTRCLKIYRQQAATGLSSTRSAPPPSIPNSWLTDPLLQRNIPTRGLKPAYYLLGVGLVMAYGWRKIFIGAREKKYAPLECPQSCTCPIPPHVQLHTLPSQPTL
jgi:hypothetical protein